MQYCLPKDKQQQQIIWRRPNHRPQHVRNNTSDNYPPRFLRNRVKHLNKKGTLSPSPPISSQFRVKIRRFLLQFSNALIRGDQTLPSNPIPNLLSAGPAQDPLRLWGFQAASDRILLWEGSVNRALDSEFWELPLLGF